MKLKSLFPLWLFGEDGVGEETGQGSRFAMAWMAHRWTYGYIWNIFAHISVGYSHQNVSRVYQELKSVQVHIIKCYKKGFKSNYFDLKPLSYESMPFVSITSDRERHVINVRVRVKKWHSRDAGAGVKQRLLFFPQWAGVMLIGCKASISSAQMAERDTCSVLMDSTLIPLWGYYSLYFMGTMRKKSFHYLSKK